MFFQMKFIAPLIILVCSTIVTTCAQPPEDIDWSVSGTSFYNVENNGIVEYQLPNFAKRSIVDSLQLIAKGHSKALKIRSFSVSSDWKKVLIYTNSKKVWRRDTRGDYWVYDVTNKTLKQLGETRPASSLMFAKISPDGTKAAFVSEHDIYVQDLASGKMTQLTFDGSARMINGTFDWAYEEEFDCRDGFRWSADSKSIAYWQIDATKIKNFLLIDNTDSLYSFTIPIEYPKVGQNPSPARIGVVNIATAKTVWMQVPGDPVQHYIPRMEWAANNTEVILEQLNRKQNQAKIFLCNTATGAASEIYTETSNAWIDVKSIWSDDGTGWEWIGAGNEFLWVSEKDGWRHIYRISRSGKEAKITEGNYDIISLKAVDEKNGFVYFMASPNNATQQYLYRISLNGGNKPELLSPAAQKGTHAYSIAPGAAYSGHFFSNLKGQWQADLVSLPTHKSIVVNGKSEGANENTAVAQLFQITTDDNITLDGWMIKPKNFDSTKKYPVLFYVYSEPGATTVKDVAGGAGTSLYKGDIAADGYIQISLDGRGTPAPKGAAWRKAIYRKVGVVNVRDQAMAARKILQWKFVDTSRVAVWGWSGGGSTTLNLLFQHPEIYKTGIAIAPVANRLLYDNIYEERYMGLPQENIEDYVKASPLTYAKSLRGSLLVVHGTGDDNVHYQGTEMLVNELVKYGKEFQMMSYPNRTHSISEGEGTRAHLSKLFTSFLRKNCPPGAR